MKSAALPPILVIFDLNTLMNGSTQDWNTFSRVGKCYLPQVVYDEIEFLTGRASEPDIERVAREFAQFFGDSGWQLTSAHTTHPSLQPAAGAATSKAARLVVAIAQCAYGLAQEHSDRLVVFVSDSQRLLQRMQSLGVLNLCCLDSKTHLQWARSLLRPASVSDGLQALKQMGADAPPLATPEKKPEKKDNRTIAKREKTRSHPPVSAKSASTTGFRQGTKSAAAAKEGYAPKAEIYKDKSEPAYVQPPRRAIVTPLKSSKSDLFVSAIYFVVAAIALATACGILWRVIQPASFNQFWQRNIEPVLPSQLRGLVK